MFEDTISGQTGGSNTQNKFFILIALIVLALYTFDSCRCTAPSMLTDAYNYLMSFVQPAAKKLENDVKQQAEKVVSKVESEA